MDYTPVFGRIGSFEHHGLTRMENPLRAVHVGYMIMTFKASNSSKNWRIIHITGNYKIFLSKNRVKTH